MCVYGDMDRHRGKDMEFLSAATTDTMHSDSLESAGRSVSVSEGESSESLVRTSSPGMCWFVCG
jgi:hypothetical protein